MLKRIFFLLTLNLLAFVAFAQVTTSSITGTVRDTSGQNLAGATITATHLPSGTKYTTVATKEGVFNIPNARVGGPYQVRIDYVGLQPKIIENVSLILGEPYAINAQLGADQKLLETVVVTGRTARRNMADRTGASTNISSRVLNTLPTITRSITDFTRITPQANNNSFAGRDGRYNNIQVDGANLNNNFGLNTDPLPGGSSQPISLDAFEEISVNIAPYDVRQGNFTGAGINAITRSGTNTFAGSVYGFYRNQSFNGRLVKEFKVPKAQQSSNRIVGARLGGPIIPNKLFFFINYEKEDRTSPGTPWRPTQPGVATGTNVSGTHIDSLRKLSEFLGKTYNYETGAFDNLPNFSVNNYKALARIDWNISNSHKLSVRYSQTVGSEDQNLNNTSVPNNGGSLVGGNFTRLPNNRFGPNSMGFENSNYGFTNQIRTGTAEWNGRFGRKFANQLIATWSKIQATRTFNGGVFPTIDILNNNNARGTGNQNQNYIHAGMDPFTNNNDVINDVYSVFNNLNYFVGKHTFTLGGNFEYQRVGNMFMPASNSYYLYGSLDSFINNQRPRIYSYTYSLIPGQEAIYSAQLKIGQLGLYLQDEINVNPKFKLTLGLRADRPIYLEQPLSNPQVANLNFRGSDGKDRTYTTGTFPKAVWMWSPRLGFRYDVEGNRNLIIRGGTGIFTGRIPFVWLTNIPTNSGMYQNSVTITDPNRLNNFRFNPNPNTYRDSFPNVGGTSIPSNANFVVTDENFKFPQVWRTNVAFDKNLGRGFVFTMEAIYTKDMNNVYMRNLNLVEPNATTQGADLRPRITGANRRYSSINSAIVLENTDQGEAFNFTTQLQKNFSRGFYGSIAYNFTHASTISNNPGSTASSVWNGNPARGTLNNPELGFANFATPHRFVGTFSYRFEYLKTLATTISLFYEGASQGNVSYVYNGDLNGDGGNSTDLMYIPRNANEIVFDGNVTIGGVTYNPAQQWEILNSFIEKTPYLSKRRGQYAERAGAQMPFFHQLDFSIQQDIFRNVGKSRHTLRFTADVLNFANMLNTNWGTRQRVFSNQPLVFRNYNAQGVPTFRLNAVNNQPLREPYQDIQTLSSTWSMQLGVRYIF